MKNKDNKQAELFKDVNLSRLESKKRGQMMIKAYKPQEQSLKSQVSYAARWMS